MRHEKMFRGLMSRCTSPHSCASARDLAAWRRKWATRAASPFSHSSHPERLQQPRKGPTLAPPGYVRTWKCLISSGFSDTNPSPSFFRSACFPDVAPYPVGTGSAAMRRTHASKEPPRQNSHRRPYHDPVDARFGIPAAAICCCPGSRLRPGPPRPPPSERVPASASADAVPRCVRHSGSIPLEPP